MIKTRYLCLSASDVGENAVTKEIMLEPILGEETHDDFKQKSISGIIKFHVLIGTPACDIFKIGREFLLSIEPIAPKRAR